MHSQSKEQASEPHYNNWPNAIGFDSHFEERKPVQLRVEGTIPSYVSGTLFRTGSGPRTVETDRNTAFKVNHWFDNFSQIHRFQIRSSGVTYTSRLLSDGVIEKVKKTGKLDGFTFGRKYEPCKSFFKKVQTIFTQDAAPKPNEVNVGVTISSNFPGLSKTGEPQQGSLDAQKLATLMTKTDANTFQMLNPETLEPIGIAHQKTLHASLKGVGSAAHAEHDPVTGDVFNYNLDFGKTGTYRIWRTSAATGKTSILATFNHPAAYLHSLLMTENYVILCVWNSSYTMGGASILWNQNLLDSMRWDGTRPAVWFVVDKRPQEAGGKGLVATFESDPMFCFHTINAYEDKQADGKIDIIADLAGYDNLDVLQRFYYDNLLSNSPSAKSWSDPSNNTSRPTYRRFRLPNIPSNPTAKPVKAVLEYKSSIVDTPELPTIAPGVITKKHRYIYGINDSGKSSFADSIIKFDIDTNTTKRWSKHGHTAGEAIFVSDPESTEEDGGVLLTVVLDGVEGKSYMLILDARDLSEVAKAHVDGVVGIAFHGLYLGGKL
jgi:torulene dioxygenase